MPKRKPTQQPAALPSNVVPFPLERSKARPVVMQGCVVPMADIHAILREHSTALQSMVTGAFTSSFASILERLEGRHV